MVEAYLAGRELTTTVMGSRIGRDGNFNGWYDYDAKYADGGSYHVVPADIPADITQACMDFAMRAHQVLGCKGVSRTDFRGMNARTRWFVPVGNKHTTRHDAHILCLNRRKKWGSVLQSCVIG